MSQCFVFWLFIGFNLAFITVTYSAKGDISVNAFFSSEESYSTFSSYDGFYFPSPDSMRGRIKGEEFFLVFNKDEAKYTWENSDTRLYFNKNNDFINGEILSSGSIKSEINTENYLIMRLLFDGLKNSPNEYAAIMLGVQ